MRGQGVVRQLWGHGVHVVALYQLLHYGFKLPEVERSRSAPQHMTASAGSCVTRMKGWPAAFWGGSGSTHQGAPDF
jgi:hypothetical protein